MDCSWPVAGTALSGREWTHGMLKEKKEEEKKKKEEDGDTVILKTRTHHLAEWWEKQYCPPCY